MALHTPSSSGGGGGDTSGLAAIAGQVFTGDVEVKPADSGSVKMNGGDAGHTGYLSWHAPDGTRYGTLGYADTGGKNIKFIAENGGSWDFANGLNVVTVGTSGNGLARIDQGDDSHTGYFSWYMPNGTRIGVVGFSGADKVINLGAENGASWKCSQGWRLDGSTAPTNNGDMIFEATSNTVLTVKYKGSDGTVRAATIALS